MRRWLALLLLTVLLLTLSGCDSWAGEEYYAETPHVAQALPTVAEGDEEEIPIVSNRSELRGTVLSFIRNWVESGQIAVADYDGDISADLSEILQYAMQEDPIGAYAVDYADAELTGNAQKGSIVVSLVFRRSAAEIASIVTVNGTTGAYTKIQQALTSYDTSLTLRIRNYTDVDFSQYVREYCLNHLQQTVALPTLSADIYPETGATRILELHFSYPDTRDELQRKLESVQTILSSASSYVSAGENELGCAALLFRFLTDRFDYTIGSDEPTMPAYELLCEGVAHSLSFAAVFRAESEIVGLKSRFVTGTHNGETHYWNILQLDGVWYHVDLMRSVLLGETELRLMTANETVEQGYAWDYGALPDGTAPTEPQVEAPTTPDPTEEEPTPTETPPIASETTEPPTEGPTEEMTEDE